MFVADFEIIQTATSAVRRVVESWVLALVWSYDAVFAFAFFGIEPHTDWAMKICTCNLRRHTDACAFHWVEMMIVGSVALTFNFCEIAAHIFTAAGVVVWQGAVRANVAG